MSRSGDFPEKRVTQEDWFHCGAYFTCLVKEAFTQSRAERRPVRFIHNQRSQLVPLQSHTSKYEFSLLRAFWNGALLDLGLHLDLFLERKMAKSVLLFFLLRRKRAKTMFVQLRGRSISISEVIKGFLSQRRAAAALGQRIASTAAHNCAVIHSLNGKLRS